MPDQCLKCLGMRSYRCRIDDWNEDACVCDLCCVPSISPYNTANHRTSLFRILKRLHQVGTNLFLFVSTAHRKNKYHIPGVQTATAKPICIARIPAVIIDPSG